MSFGGRENLDLNIFKWMARRFMGIHYLVTITNSVLAIDGKNSRS